MTEELQAPVTEQVTTETPAVETPVVERQEQKPDPKDLRAVIEHAQKEVTERARDETGKFVKAEKAPAAKSAAPEIKSPQGATAGTEAKPLEAPATWTPEQKAQWGTIPRPLQEAYLKREKEFAQGIEAKANELKEVRAFREALEPVIGPHRQYLMQAGSVEAGIKNLLDTSSFAAQHPVQFIQWFAQQKGVDLSTMQQQPQGEVNPEVAQLRQMVNGLQGQLQQFTSHAQEQRQRTLTSEIEAFANAKDQQGAPLRPHFETVRAEIFELIPLIRAKNPAYSVTQVMEAAYERAVRVNDEVWGKIQSEKAEKDRLAKEAAERAAKAKLALKSLTGGSPVGETQQKKAAKDRSVRADILAAMEEHGVDARV
jgi:hypothetical protein